MNIRPVLFFLFLLGASILPAQNAPEAPAPPDEAKLEESLAPRKREAEQGDAHAAQQVYLRYAAAGRMEEAKRWWNKFTSILEGKAREGDVNAQLTLAAIALQGSTFSPPDQAIARHWLRKAADADSATGAYLLAGLTEKDKDDPDAARKAASWYEKALNLYRRMVENGETQNGAAYFWIGTMTLEGQGTPADPQRAIAWLHKAHDAGYAAASARLAQIYAPGGACPDPQQAFRYFRYLADEEHSPAMMYLTALQYGRGDGVEADAQQAAAYMQRAADAGYPPALLAQAATALKEGDARRALPLYERAASLGNVTALTQTGLMYLRGTGTPRDEEKGLALLRFASDQHGDAIAAYELARYYEDRGDSTQADGWYFTASDRGVPAAMARRGLLHLVPGSGYAWNPIRSYHWWRIGKERGDAASATYLAWLLWAGLPLAAVVLFVLPLSLIAKLHRDSLRREREEEEAANATTEPGPTDGPDAGNGGSHGGDSRAKTP